MADEFNPDKLFQEVSKAMQEEDTLKVSELLAQETPDTDNEQEHPEDELPADEPEDDTEETSEEEESDNEEEESPSEKTGKKDDDPLAELRTQLAALQKENQSLRSQAGRVPHVQRKLDEMDKKLAQLMASPSSQASAKITPKVEQLLKDIDDTDPTLAKALKEVVATAVEGIDEEHRSREIENLRALREQEARAYQETEAQRLLQMYPMAPQVFASPQWAEWKKEQPDHVLKLAQASDADAVALAFELYARDMQAKYPETVAPKLENNDEANRVEEERKRKKQTAANLDRGNAPLKDKGPADPAALFAKFSEEIRKELNG